MIRISIVIALSLFLPTTITIENQIPPVKFVPQVVEAKEICESIYDYGCSCMVHLQNRGYDVSGNASELQPNYFGIPFVGDLALFKYETIYHAAIVEIVYLSGNFEVSECNFEAGKCDSRLVLINDKALRGFIHRVSNFY